MPSIGSSFSALAARFEPLRSIRTMGSSIKPSAPSCSRCATATLLYAPLI